MKFYSPFLSLTFISLLLIGCGAKSLEDKVGTRPGMVAPSIKGETISGKSFDLKDLRGNLVIIDFWATWCAPCMREAPVLVNLYANTRGQGLEVLSIALEKKNDGRAEQVGNRLGFMWPNQLAEEISFVRLNALASAYGVTDIPATFLIDAEGKILLGKSTVNEIEEYLNQTK